MKQGGTGMAKMRAIDAAVRVLEKEGVSTAFGVPGAAINPLYSAICEAPSTWRARMWRMEPRAFMAE